MSLPKIEVDKTKLTTSPRLLVKFKGSQESPKVLKPGDKLRFTLTFDRGESSWELNYEELEQYVGVQHSIVEVKYG